MKKSTKHTIGKKIRTEQDIMGKCGGSEIK
jgi:hypothetical protein